MTLDTWTADGARISSEVLSRLRSIIDDESALIVEHRVYRGASAPRRFVCDDFDELERYVLKSTKPGDSLWFWNFENCCRDDDSVAHGKTPDEQGRVPMSGAY